jgi:S-DNA-T family DNA segregation ATPase FtsK/SpoIIIE
MMVLNSGDQLPETVAAAIGRALWRYRSELAPIAFAALTVLAAMSLHRTHRGSWPWLAVATVCSMTVLAIPVPARLRKALFVLGRPVERVYAAAVAAVTGGWLTAATALGPATPPMPALAGSLALVCALPWWASRRRRPKVASSACSNRGQRSPRP